jgi:hypothetical protein
VISPSPSLHGRPSSPFSSKRGQGRAHTARPPHL